MSRLGGSFLIAKKSTVHLTSEDSQKFFHKNVLLFMHFFLYRKLAPFLFLRSVSAEVSAVSAEVSAVSAESCLQRFVSAAKFSLAKFRYKKSNVFSLKMA